MTSVATGVMVLICSLVWGGFLWLLARAVRREGAKGIEPEVSARQG